MWAMIFGRNSTTSVLEIRSLWMRCSELRRLALATPRQLSLIWCGLGSRIEQTWCMHYHHSDKWIVKMFCIKVTFYVKPSEELKGWIDHYVGVCFFRISRESHYKGIRQVQVDWYTDNVYWQSVLGDTADDIYNHGVDQDLYSLCIECQLRWAMIGSSLRQTNLQGMQLVWGERIQDPMWASTCWTKRVLHSHIVFVTMSDPQLWLGFNHLKRCELIRKCVWEREEHEVNLRELFRLHQQDCCASTSTIYLCFCWHVSVCSFMW